MERAEKVAHLRENSLFEGYGLQAVRLAVDMNRLKQPSAALQAAEKVYLSPAGTAELSRGRQSWVEIRATKSPEGTTGSCPRASSCFAI